EFAALGSSLLDSPDDISRRSALANFNKALRLNPDCTEALSGKASLMQQLGNLEEAEMLLERVIVLSPKNFEPLFQLGLLKYRSHNYPGAMIALKKALRLKKNNPDIHDALADVYESIRLTDQAEVHRLTARKLRKK
ncbi:MAG: tetratricopeptide repeat protein, partial [Muribaculaceae bacterium]